MSTVGGPGAWAGSATRRWSLYIFVSALRMMHAQIMEPPGEISAEGALHTSLGQRPRK